MIIAPHPATLNDAVVQRCSASTGAYIHSFRHTTTNGRSDPSARFWPRISARYLGTNWVQTTLPNTN